MTFIFGFCVRSRISKSKSGFPNRTQPLIGNLNQVTSYANVLLASRGLLWAWDCWRCITWLRQNHSNSAIRHLRNEKGTGAEMRPAIVSGILLGDTRLSLCFKTRVQSYWYENDFLYVMRRKLIFQLTNVLHLASLWKWDFLELANGLFSVRKSLNRMTKTTF